ncbi:MAG: FUSC family protein [Candidatus Nanopelagicales bacterium]
MSTQTGAVARSALRTSLAVDRARILWLRGLRTGLVVSAVILASVGWASATAVVSLALGAAFVGFADSTDPDRNRFVGLLITLAGYLVATCLGGLIADFPVLHVLGSSIAAAVCGYVGVIGPRTALGGTIALVLVTMYSGSPGALDGGVIASGWLLLGGVAYLVVAVPGWLLRRAEGLRTVLSTAYRGVGYAAQGADHTVSTTAVALMPMIAQARATDGEVRGPSRSWAVGLADDCAQLRLALIALSTEHRVTARRLEHSVAHTMRHIGGALRFPPRRRAIPGALAQVRTAADVTVAEGTPPVLVTAVTGPLERAARAVTDPWPVGRRAEFGPPPPLAVHPGRVLREHLTWSDPFVRHALRLSLAIAVATVISLLLPMAHGYWVPLTVAWIAKPDLAGTVTRVVMRIGGTVVGLVLAIGLVLVVTGPVSFALAVGFGALLVGAFLYANYTVAVAGITSFVIVLLALTGDPVRTTLVPRLVDTVIAGVIVVTASLVFPRAAGASVHRDLADLARTGAAYSDAVFAGAPDAMTERRIAVLRVRTRAEAAAHSAAQEPIRHELDPHTALIIMADLRLVSEQLIRWHELSGTEEPPAGLAAAAHDGLMCLADRLEQPRTPTPCWSPPPDSTPRALDLLDPVAEAHARLPAG